MNNVIEVSGSPTPLPELTPDLKDSLRSLQFHPGFVYLLTRLRLERAQLRKCLEQGYQLEHGALRHLQAGVHYTGYIEDTLLSLTATPAPPKRDATLNELELFNKVRENLELVGA